MPKPAHNHNWLPSNDTDSEAEIQEDSTFTRAFVARLLDRYGAAATQHILDEIDRAERGKVTGFGFQRPFPWCQ